MIAALEKRSTEYLLKPRGYFGSQLLTSGLKIKCQGSCSFPVLKISQNLFHYKLKLIKQLPKCVNSFLLLTLSHSLSISKRHPPICIMFCQHSASTKTFLGCAAILEAAQPLNPVIVVFCCCSVVLLLLAFLCFTKGHLT